ncbi:MAG: hypothetical protein WAT78_10965 [Rhizobiaceae bacterium]
MRLSSIILAGALSLAAVLPAHAIKRYNIANMSCEKVQSVVRNDGAAILRYPSTKVAGMTLYDRYVRNSSYCNLLHEYAERAWVPAKDDKTCAVKVCKPRIDDEFRRLRRHLQ